MKKIILTFIIALIVATVVAVPALADGPTGQAGKSNIGHLYLNEKNPDTWEIVDKDMDGAWGKMKYNLTCDTFDFVFNGHDLEPGESYSLIYYPDPWPGTGLICLGTAIADEEGNVHIKASVDTGNLPAEYDENEGAKIWLTLSGDIDIDSETSSMIGWNPTEYLFEYDLINYNACDEVESVETTSSVKPDKPDKPGRPENPGKSNERGNVNKNK
ncbi:hypothetical protein ACFLS8_03760 [Chloroflexota bacterium]